MKKKQQLTKRGYFKKYRERIFKNNQVILTTKERCKAALNEFQKNVDKLTISENDTAYVEVDIYDPYTSVKMFIKKKSYTGYSKRMPNDIPNDRIAIQVAVSRLIKRLKNG